MSFASLHVEYKLNMKKCVVFLNISNDQEIEISNDIIYDSIKIMK